MTEGNLIKIDGDILYASEIVEMSKSLKSYTEANNFQLIQNGAMGYNEIDNTYMELFKADTAGSTTNLTMDTTTEEYYSTTPGAYELITESYETEDNCDRCYCFFDYSIYKVISETDLTSSISASSGTDTDNSSDIISEKSLLLKYYISASSSSGNAESQIRITDGTNYATIISDAVQADDNGNKKGFIKIINDTTNKKIKYFIFSRYYFYNSYGSGDYAYYIDNVDYGEVDYSTWGSNLYLQTYAYAQTTGTVVSTIYYIRAYKQNPTTDATIEISSDNGSNYKEITNGTYAILTSGNQFKAKISGTLASGEGITIKKVILKPE